MNAQSMWYRLDSSASVELMGEAPGPSWGRGTEIWVCLFVNSSGPARPGDVVCSDMIGRHRSITQHHLAKRTSTVTPTVALLLGSTLLCLCTHRALTCNTFRLHTTVDENHEIVPRRRDLSNSKALEQQLGVVAEWLTRLTRMVCHWQGF